MAAVAEKNIGEKKEAQCHNCQNKNHYSAISSIAISTIVEEPTDMAFLDTITEGVDLSSYYLWEPQFLLSVGSK